MEKQKQLKRARIADAISDHLCQRPGPLELVRANILHTTEPLEKAVKGESRYLLCLGFVSPHHLFSCGLTPHFHGEELMDVVCVKGVIVFFVECE